MPNALTNLEQLYLYTAGETEVPEVFQRFSLLSTVAAMMQNKTWYCKEKPGRLFPNLYVMLIGPSGAGKGTAIGRALNLTQEFHETIGLYQGKTTASFVAKWFHEDYGKSTHDGGATSRLFLVTPELALGVGSGDLADDLVKRMTDLFTGELLAFNDGTAKFGLRKAGKPVANWLAGTTKEWLANLRGQTMKGGFFARCLLVQGDYDHAKRLVRPIYPPDHDELWAILVERLREIGELTGEFVMDPSAVALEEVWYNHREPPLSVELVPSWKRMHDLVIKVAMIFSVYDNLDRVITSKHLHKAIAAVEQVKETEEDIVDFLEGTADQANIDFVARKIKQVGIIGHSILLRKCAKRGIKAYEVRSILDTLIQGRNVVIEDKGRQDTHLARFYRWVGYVSDAAITCEESGEQIAFDEADEY